MSFNKQQCKQPCMPSPSLQKTQGHCQAKAEEVCLPPCQHSCQKKYPVQAQEVHLPQCQELNQENFLQQGQDPCLPLCQDQSPPQCVETCQEISQTNVWRFAHRKSRRSAYPLARESSCS
uniref:Proline rich 9 n=1 Tax=Tursiops truncatus TaxID=9739 RepID=I6WKF2_TURTR|nr:proline rich 9 [Tursiops truncatus]